MMLSEKRKTMALSEAQRQKLAKLAEFLRLFRNSQTPVLTFTEIQRRGGPVASVLSEIEGGKCRSFPKPQSLERLAEALRIPYVDLQRVMGDLPLTGNDANRTSQDLESRKPWPLHDLSQTTTPQNEVTRGIEDTKSNQIMATGPFRAGEGSGIPEDSLKGSTSAHPPLPAYMERVDWTSGPILRLPVFEISCGEPIILPDHPDLIEKWPRDMVGDVDAKMIVRGTSMIGLGYMPGDELFVKLLDGVRPKHGDKVVAEVNGGATCKLYQDGPQGPYLMGVSEPGTAPMIIWVTPEVRIVGVVKKRITDA